MKILPCCHFNTYVGTLSIELCRNCWMSCLLSRLWDYWCMHHSGQWFSAVLDTCVKSSDYLGAELVRLHLRTQTPPLDHWQCQSALWVSWVTWSTSTTDGVACQWCPWTGHWWKNLCRWAPIYGHSTKPRKPWEFLLDFSLHAILLRSIYWGSISTPTTWLPAN